MEISLLIRELANDQQSGAAQLLQRACRMVEKLVPAQIEPFAMQLSKVHPAMAPLHQLATRLLEGEEATSVAREMAQISTTSAARIAQEALIHVKRGAQIATHSASGTVEAALRLAASEQGVRVVIGEGRPGFEGRALAERLANDGIEVTLCTDGAELELLQTCDLLFVGGDAVSATRFINKVGTLALLLGATHFGVPTYLLCDATKRVEESFIERPIPLHPPKELLDQAPTSLTVKNPYYERIPRDGIELIA